MNLRQLLVSGLTLLTLSLSGCGSRETAAPTDGTSPAADGADVHDHPTEGPHHGRLIELGNDEYHAELVHDKESVTIYILDSAAKASVPIAASEVTINVLHDGKPEQFILPASPDAADGEGMSSRFTLTDADLAGHIDEETAAPKLNVTIEGTPYVGEIKHSHDDHEHAH